MKVIDWFNKIFKKNKIDKTDVHENNKNDWKRNLHCEPTNAELIENLEQKQKRIDQIKMTEALVLYKEGYLKKEDISNNINKIYEHNILQDVEMQSLIAIYDAMQYEDLHGEDNIREFIEEDNDNIVKLVDKLVENAKKKAKKYKITDASEFVDTDIAVINKLKDEIEEQEEKNIKE